MIQYDQLPSRTESLAYCDVQTGALMVAASALRDQCHGSLISYSRKVFIPLTQLCRDVCHYCTFAKAPRRLDAPYITPEQVLDVARRGRSAGCKEALFTLGDKPELRYGAARDALAEMGYETTLDYLAAMARLVFDETGLMPHLNPGLMTADEIAMLREVSVSMGIMLESGSTRLMQKGGCHFGSPDKDPSLRMATIDAAGQAKVPFTTGILIGIGETRKERVDSLLMLRDAHERHGHLQEIIIQNFRAKPDTRMANVPEPDLDDLQWTIAVARLIFGAEMTIQAPPNLTENGVEALIAAGINDFGGISPVTPDHVNPEAPWPHLDDLAAQVGKSGKVLVERLGVYPSFAHANETWLAKSFRKPVLDAINCEGLVRSNSWVPGDAFEVVPQINPAPGLSTSAETDRLLVRAMAGDKLGEAQITRLFSARGAQVHDITAAADELRKKVSGNTVSYVVTRNINYTNICYFKCKFCAFSKGKTLEKLRGKPYNLGPDIVASRAREAWDRGAVEVCLQGGIHPDYTGQTYLDIVSAIKSETPGMHVHAFSPLEVHQGAETLGLPVPRFLERLINAGLGSLPGTAAEILDDEVRARLCPDKINTSEWFHVVDNAHRLGLKTTATIMFGHIDQPEHWARHLLRLRAQQAKSGGFTELVPLPFVHMESPIYLKGGSRKGPTWRECLLLHAVSRLVLNPLIPNIQASWVKLGPEGVAQTLSAGVNDIGGTLMDETITRSAGAEHGQEMTPRNMEALLARVGRPSRQRTTLYEDADAERITTSFIAAE